MKSNVKTVIVPDVRCVVIDETKLWSLGHIEMDRSNLLRIETVCVYDRNERTFCCEITPSYMLVEVEHRPIFRAGCDPEDDGTREQWDELMRSNVSVEARYYHCGVVATMREVDTYAPTKGWDVETTSESAIEEAREYYQGNSAPS